MAIKHLPQMTKIGKAWVIQDFYPTRGAVYWNETRHKTSTLYVIECAGFCKIGYATNFHTRFRTLDCSNPLPIRKAATRTISESAIEAMREPSATMKAAGSAIINASSLSASADSFHEAYQRAISAAINETAGTERIEQCPKN